MKDTYSIRDLMERYKCAASTIYRYMNLKGYPRGGQVMGSRKKISGVDVYEWEVEHMPWLHPNTDAQARMEEDETWKGIQERHDAALTGGGRAKAEKRKVGWPDLRRDVKKIIVHKGVIMKPRHGKKPVARTGV